MKRVTMDRTIELGSREYEINADESRELGCFVEILAKVESNLTAMLSYHCKVLVVQFIIHCHDYEPRNDGISDLMRVLKKRLARRYVSQRVTGGWVRETGVTGIQHYHVAIFLDGNKVRWDSDVQALVIKILEERNYPRPAAIKGHLVVRRDEKSVNKAFYHLSYLAKTRTKKNRPPATNDYSFSRLRPKP